MALHRYLFTTFQVSFWKKCPAALAPKAALNVFSDRKTFRASCQQYIIVISTIIVASLSTILRDSLVWVFLPAHFSSTPFSILQYCLVAYGGLLSGSGLHGRISRALGSAPGILQVLQCRRFELDQRQNLACYPSSRLVYSSSPLT